MLNPFKVTETVAEGLEATLNAVAEEGRQILQPILVVGDRILVVTLPAPANPARQILAARPIIKH